MDQGVKILMVTPFFRPNIGGAEAYLHDLCEYLRRRGHFVYVLTYQPLTTRTHGKAIERQDNLEVRRFWWPGFNLFHKLEPYPLLEFLYLTPWLFIRTWWFLFWNHQNIDVIHAHGFNAAFMIGILGWVFRKPRVMSTYAIYNLKPGTLKSRMISWSLSSFKRIFALAPQSRDELIGIGVDGRRIEIYNLWVDEKMFPPPERARAKQMLELEGKFVVLFVGRLIEIKGPRLIAEVAARTSADICFVFIGDGPLAEELRLIVQGHPNALFVGKVDQETLNHYYHAADLTVVPSQYDEAFGKVIIEALICGTPVVGSNRGRIPEVLDSSVGRVVEPTVADFQREIEYLYGHREELARLTNKARVYALERFGEKNASKVETSYSLILGNVEGHGIRETHTVP